MSFVFHRLFKSSANDEMISAGNEKKKTCNYSNFVYILKNVKTPQIETHLEP